MKKVNVAIMGLGTVGGGTYDILTQNREMIIKTQGLEITVKRILDKAIDKVVMRGISRDVVTDNIDDVVNDKSISIVVEVMGGIEPAKTFITKALKSGKSVVTANKELISKHWWELEKIAKDNGVGLYFEASCVGGVPIIRTLNESCQGDNFMEIMGIINGTTNYILTKMTEEGMSYGDALKEAQDLGYAEFNPTADVDGYDAMYKLSILSSLAFHTCIPYTCIYREGISNITKNDIAIGKTLGYTLKLLAIGRKEGNRIEVRVHPAFVGDDHPLASVRNSFNAVFLKGDSVDDVMLYGRGAGARPTGSAIVSDIVHCALRSEHKYADFVLSDKTEDGVEIETDFKSQYYITINAADKPGVLSKITKVMGENNVSIKTVLQKGSNGGSYAPVVFLTHETHEKSIQNAIAEIKALSCVKEVESLIRVI